MKLFRSWFCLAVSTILISSLFIQNASAQNPGEWMWINGSNISTVAVFGVQGVSSPANTPPGVYEACEWTDHNGNFWMYGGAGGGTWADLWKYDPLINEWTWVKGPGVGAYAGTYGLQGVPDPLNNPPARSHGAATWVDLQGNLWMFGGINSGAALSDLWKYDISTNIWTWMKGPSFSGQSGTYGTQGVPSILNEPGARREIATAWMDNSGDLWLFGGYFPGLFNDLWRYTMATNEWTWMKGSNFTGQTGVYGTQGVEDPMNTPGARMSHCRWTDNSGNFWLFGGGDYFADDYYNDLWRFNTLTNNWAWMRGSSSPNSSGTYGTVCTPSQSSDPPARFENRVAWKDPSGNLWTYAGSQDGGMGEIWNDIWMYCISTNTWTWMEGSNMMNPIMSWGTKGVSSPTNQPDGRGGSLGWADNSGHFYMFGGWGSGTRNDLWVYAMDSACYSCSSFPVALFNGDDDICPGTCASFNSTSLYASSYIWSFPGANPASSTDADPSNICYNTPGNYDVQLIVTNSFGSDTLLLPNYVTVYPFPPPQGIQQIGDTLLANQGGTSYQWYHNGSIIPGATDYYYVASQGGDYNVVVTDENDCEVEAVINDVIADISQVPLTSSQLAIFPNPVSEELTIHFNIATGSHVIGKTTSVICIYNVIGEKIFTDGFPGEELTVDCGNFSSGIYFVELTTAENSFRIKFVKE
jgi:hypothetical protein